MNKTEAIKVLKKDLKIIDDPKVTMTAREWEEHDDHMRDALEMAIEALEKEETLQNLTKPNKSDCISRQDAIEALDQDVMGGLNYRRILRLLPSADRPTLTPEEFAEKMAGIAENGDEERKHVAADSIMCELLKSLGFGEGVGIFEDMDKWYS